MILRRHIWSSGILQTTKGLFRTQKTHLTNPKMFSLCDGFLLDQMYTKEKANEADKNGNVKSGDIT